MLKNLKGLGMQLLSSKIETKQVEWLERHPGGVNSAKLRFSISNQCLLIREQSNLLQMCSFIHVYLQPVYVKSSRVAEVTKFWKSDAVLSDRETTTLVFWW